MKKFTAKVKTLQIQENIHRVYDEDGSDVTPQPFVDPFTKIKTKPARSMFSSQGSFTKSPSIAGTDRSAGEQHIFHVDSLQGSARFESLVKTAAKVELADEEVETEDAPPETIEKTEDVQVFKLTLKETNTMWHLEIPSTAILEDSPEAETLKAEIERYNWLTEGKGRNRKRMDAETQTINMPAKRKGTMTSPIETKSVHTFVSAWDIYDTYEKLDTEERVASSVDGKRFNEVKESDFPLTDVESFLNSAMILERMLASNSYRFQQALYTGFAESSDDSERRSQFQYVLHPLWVYQSAVTKGRAVISFSWNLKNKDILAVGYGQWLVTDEVRSGLVCCWSVKNPTNPEKSFAQVKPVSCVRFSNSKPHLLAVALLDGSLHLVDVASPSRRPTVLTCKGNSQHCGPIWGLQWTSEWSEHKGREILVSTGDDGQLLRWMFDESSSLHSIDGMKLCAPLLMVCLDAPLTGTHAACDVPVKHVLSGLALELCLNGQPPTLHVATNEGYLVEVEAEIQLRRSRKAHRGPVFSVQASPFCPQLIMTAGAEGTVSLWTIGSDQPLLNLQVADGAVVGAVWSPSHCNILATASGNALSLWDISRRTHAPVASVILPSLLSAVTFCPAGRNLLVGDRVGSVHVFNLQDMPYAPFMQLEALLRAVPGLRKFITTNN